MDNFWRTAMKQLSLILLSILGAIFARASELIDVRMSSLDLQLMNQDYINKLQHMERCGLLHIENTNGDLLLTFEKRSDAKNLINKLKSIGIVSTRDSVVGSHTDGATTK